MKSTAKLIASLVVVLLIIAASFYFAEYISKNDGARELVNSYGYFGAYITATLLGLSAIAPVPPAIFMPVFVTAGLLPVLIILFLSLGTLTADLFGYFLGNVNATLLSKKFPRLTLWFEKLHTNNYLLLITVVFLYAAFVPLPNELVVISLGALGARLQPLLAPLFLGSVVHHTVFAFGTQGLYSFLF